MQMHLISDWSRALSSKYVYNQGLTEWRQEVGLEPTGSESLRLYETRNGIIRSKGRGSDAWVKLLVSCARILDYPALRPIIGPPGTPQARYPVGKMMKKRGQAKLYGHDTTVERLEALPHHFLSFVTTTLEIVSSPQEHEECADRALAKFIRRIKRVFPCSKGFFNLETKPVSVWTQPVGVLADARWKDRWKPNQVVHKLHVHGFLYAPYVHGYTDQNKLYAAEEYLAAVTRVIQFNSNGTRNVYSGNAQVHVDQVFETIEDPVQPGWQKNGSIYIGGKEAEALNLDRPRKSAVSTRIGYMLKGHVNPPDPTEPRLGFADTLYLNHQNLTLPSRRARFGLQKNSPTMIWCPKACALTEWDGDRDLHKRNLLISIHDEFYGEPENNDGTIELSTISRDESSELTTDPSEQPTSPGVQVRPARLKLIRWPYVTDWLRSRIHAVCSSLAFAHNFADRIWNLVVPRRCTRPPG